MSGFLCLFLYTIDVDQAKVLPPHQVAVLNRSVSYTCHSQTKVMWRFNNDKLPINAISRVGLFKFQHILKIINLRLQNTGVYTCYGSYDGKKFKSEASLKVIGK